ncbi:Topoisomerase 1-associated factor 1 [Globomyces sp. JEL0801]|nr:Topoisomerase 1-associated factor 1 [Globomyces sp. JEL0801]
MNDDVSFQNHLLRVCAALGGFENGRYEAGDEALDCLRDLKRFLRMDEHNDDRPAHALLGKWNVLNSDLLHLLIVAVQSTNFKMAFAVCEVLVPLTWPTEKPTANDLDILVSYKRAFLQKGVWGAVLAVILKLISIPMRKRSETDHARLKLVLCLIRNVLAINDTQDHINSSNQAYLKSTYQEELIQRLQEEDVIDFLLSLAGSANELEFRQWNTLVLEIFFHIFYGRNVNDLIEKTSMAPKSSLASLLQKEKISKKPANGRHARFGGTLAINTTNGSQIHVPKLPEKKTAAFDSMKKAANKKWNIVTTDMIAEKPLILSTSSKVFYNIAKSFSDNCINELLPSVKRDFDVEKDSLLENDYLHFFFVMGFFMEFFLATNKEFSNFESITGVIDNRMTAFIFRKMHNYLDEKLLGLVRMDASTDEEVRQASLQIQSQLFYEETNLQLIVSLSKQDNPRSKRYMECLVNVIDIIFGLLEANWNTGSGFVTRRKTKANTVAEEDEDEEDYEHLHVSHERVFAVAKFEQYFGYDSVIDTYCTLLKYYKSLDVSTLKQITKMFQRISHTEKCDKESLFYHASILYRFNEILNDPVSKLPIFDDLILFIKVTISSFSLRINDNPLLIFEIFCPKTKSDCYRIQNGDDEVDLPWDFEPETNEVTNVNVVDAYSVPSTDPIMRNDQIRGLSTLISKTFDGTAFIKWLASVYDQSMRKVMYDDFDDIIAEDERDNGIALVHFVTDYRSPPSVSSILDSQNGKLLLGLLGFEEHESETVTWKFPKEIELETIESLERLKLFSKRPPVKKPTSRKRKSAVELDAEADPTNYTVIDSPTSRKSKKNHPSKDSLPDENVPSSPIPDIVTPEDNADFSQTLSSEAALRLPKNQKFQILLAKKRDRSRREQTNTERNKFVQDDYDSLSEPEGSDRPASISNTVDSSLTTEEPQNFGPEKLVDEIDTTYQPTKKASDTSTKRRLMIVDSSDDEN